MKKNFLFAALIVTLTGTITHSTHNNEESFIQADQAGEVSVEQEAINTIAPEMAEAILQFKESASEIGAGSKKMLNATTLILHYWGRDVQKKTEKSVASTKGFFQKTGSFFRTVGVRFRNAYNAFVDDEHITHELPSDNLIA